MSLPLQPALATHLPEVVATMAGRTQRLQVGAGTISRDVIQVGHRQQKPPGSLPILRHHRASLQVSRGADSLHEVLWRFPRAQTGATTELTTPVHLGLDGTGHRAPVRRI